jgi:hypothetical protein
MNMFGTVDRLPQLLELHQSFCYAFTLYYDLYSLHCLQMAVCALELLPEARKCKEDLRLIQGVGFGSVIMLATLWAGV